MFDGLFSAALNYLGTKDTNDTNIDLSRENRDFQERMSSTAYQRAVGDMQKAGLNPMLAYSQGGASAPVGSMPQIQNALGAAVSGAQQGVAMMQAAAQIKQSEAQTAQLEAGTRKIDSETMEKELNTARAYSDLYKVHTDTGKSDAERRRTEEDAQNIEVERRQKLLDLQRGKETFSADVARRRAESQLSVYDLPKAKAEADFYSGSGQLSPYVRQLLELLRGVSSVKSLILDNPRGVRSSK